MHDIDIYAIGNALVDFEIEVSEDELELFNIEKGTMTLVDEAEQQQIFESLHGKTHQRASGGSAANSIIAAQQLGAQCFYSCTVANDEAGDFYSKDLHATGVKTNLHDRVLPAGNTGRCLVMVSPDAERTMLTYLGVTADVTEATLHFEDLAKAKFLYIEGYLASSELALNAIEIAKKYAQDHGVKVACSLSDPNIIKYFRSGIESIVGDKVDLLFCNQHEAMDFTQTRTLEQACQLLQQKAHQFVLTLGSDGALLFDGQNMQQVASHKVEAIDTNGAGDMFAGVCLYGLTQGYDLLQSSKVASYAAAQVVSDFGPRLNPEKMTKVKDFVNKNI